MSPTNVYAELRAEVSCYLEDEADVACFLQTPLDLLAGHTPEEHVALRGQRGLAEIASRLPRLMPTAPEEQLQPLASTSLDDLDESVPGVVEFKHMLAELDR